MTSPHVVEKHSVAYEVGGFPGRFGSKDEAYLTAARMMVYRSGVRCKYDIKEIKRLKARLARYLAFVDGRRA